MNSARRLLGLALAAALTGFIIPGTANASMPPENPVQPLSVSAPAEPGDPVVNPVSVATAIVPGAQGFDSANVDSASQLTCLKNSGITFDAMNVLDPDFIAEYRDAATAGMNVILFQGYYPPHWSIFTKATERANRMVAGAQSVGYPVGAQLFLDLEDNQSDGTRSITRDEMVAWVQEWARVVTAAGYVPGMYVGLPQVLTASDLGTRIPGIKVFWRSASTYAPQAPQGFVVQQPQIDITKCGITIDTNVAGIDNNGNMLVGAGFPAGQPVGAGLFHVTTPTRLLDTRDTAKVTPFGTVSIKVTGVAGVPTNVKAVVLNITALNANGTGFVTAHASLASRPLASNLNFSPGSITPNLATVPVGTDGKISLYNGSEVPLDLIADIQGYYLDGTPTLPGAFGTTTPTRLLDTRDTAKVTPFGTVSIKVTGVAGVPTNVKAVVLNITALNANGTGFVTAHASLASRPLASNLNFSPGSITPNLATVPVGTDGKISLYNGSEVPLDLIADIQGYYLDGTPTLPGAFGTTTPTRLLDTRDTAKVTPFGTVSIKVTGVAGVPTNVKAVVLNITALNANGTGFVTAHASLASRPLASNLNFSPGSITPNLATVPVGTDGKISLYNGSEVPLDLIADIQGYYLDGQ
ncbi:DUF1906 domain-containing protein [Nakamurella antarctica]|uniref:DUF1906 domain-containing protein n=1 Tax=Nakamurella antarctica TaxID=1902245 RepID=A0A3G8ZMN7_9ACTN|nr:glycoside hydrolase domain-containing protein [Nakamurella antarctica]AZI58513.1 DUF1906 domain-containing protein [Nakamurella antarctica]